MSLISINPSSGKEIERFRTYDEDEIALAVQEAYEAFKIWRRTAFTERSDRMRAAADLLRRDRERHAVTMAKEMGKPVAQGAAEIDKCARVCDFYAEHAERMLAPESASSDGSMAYVRFDPIGPVLAVMPWNFPFWQVFRFAAPALMAGNTALLKHASNVTRCALNIEETFSGAGFPQNAFRTLPIESAAVESVIRNPLVAAATLTGSEAAGAAVASAAGSVVKKCVLELGGADPFIVLDDADMEAAASTAATARCINGGQSCIAAKRFIVTPGAAGAFIDRFVSAMSAKRVGDPLDPAVDIGPLAREDLLLELDAQVKASVASGARLLLGGERLPDRGAFYPPTVLDEVSPGMPAWSEELFGPTAAVIRARDEDHAIDIANATEFGLGASIWTADTARAEALAARIEAGSVFINGLVKSDPRLPFGGIRKSGFGRELGTYGIREFVNIKTVWIA